MTETYAQKGSYNINFERNSELISNYEQIKRSGDMRKYNEESTKKDFVLPLFKGLGWKKLKDVKRLTDVT